MIREGSMATALPGRGPGGTSSDRRRKAWADNAAEGRLRAHVARLKLLHE